MGQYYNSVLKNEKGEIKSYYNFGLKLMEHSWFSNAYVNSVCEKLINNPHHIAWVGDYADEEDYVDRDNAEMVKSLVDYRVNDNPAIELKSETAPYGLFGYLLINHSRKLFINMEDYYRNSVLNYGEDRKDAWVIHPLPLLTAVGNGKGGGDYYRKALNVEDVGIWAGDLIEVKKYDDDYQWNRETKQWQYKDYIDITDDVLFDEGY